MLGLKYKPIPHVAVLGLVTQKKEKKKKEKGAKLKEHCSYPATEHTHTHTMIFLKCREDIVSFGKWTPILLRRGSNY